jgi:hypothetical protein
MGTRCLAAIIWKFIIQHFYSIHTVTAPTNTALIWMKSHRRYADLCPRHEAQSRLLIAQLFDRGKPLLQPKSSTLYSLLAPLAQLNSAFQLRWSDSFCEELSAQELDQFIRYGRYCPQTRQPT